jgi:hypothetical protein
MKAYYTTNNGFDAIVIPATGVVMTMFDEYLAEFVCQNTDFSQWTSCYPENDFEPVDGEEELTASRFGEIVAVRDDSEGKAQTPVYKGYRGSIEKESSSEFFGRVNLSDVVTFKGETLRDAIVAFRDSVDDYLEFIDTH